MIPGLRIATRSCVASSRLRPLALLSPLILAASLGAQPGPSVLRATKQADGSIVARASGEKINLGTYHALLVGINDYQTVNDLKTAVKDAETTAGILRKHYGFESIRILRDRKATRRAILDQLETYRRLTKKDNFLLYFAGHGYQDPKTGDGYWIPSDGADTSSSWISVEELKLKLRNIGAKHILVVSDSCFSGALSRNFFAPAIDRYVLEVHAKDSCQVIASGGLEPVADRGRNGLSLFAYYFTSYLRDYPGAYITSLHLYSELAPVVANASNSQQTPEHGPILGTFDNRGEFIFARVQPPRPQPGDLKIKIPGGIQPVVPASKIGVKPGPKINLSQLLIHPNKLKAEPKLSDLIIQTGAEPPPKTTIKLEGLKLEPLPVEKIALSIVLTPQEHGIIVPGFVTLGSNPQGYREYRHLRTGLTFVRLPAGKFLMGSLPLGQSHRGPDELLHEVELGPFLIAKDEVDRKTWREIMKSEPPGLENDTHPVTSVSWKECIEFCRRTGLQLPSEAQWEYACRGGKSLPYAFAMTRERALWSQPGILRLGPNPVGSFPPNDYGLRDLHGNVWEWCADLYDAQFYSTDAAKARNPVCRSGLFLNVRRGGGYHSQIDELRSANRDSWLRDRGAIDLGFRPVFTLY